MGFTPGVGKVSDLSDTFLSNPANSDVLTYDAGLWKNAVGTTAPQIGVASTQKTASFTLSLAEAGKIVECESASPITVTVPPSSSVSWLSDTLIELSQTGAGQVTVAPGAGVTLRTAAAPAGLKTRSQWSGVSLRKRATVAQGLPTANLLARWRADDLSGTDQSAVTAWPESSGNNLPDAVQNTAANQPKLRTAVAGLNGHKAVEFDGSNDFLSLSGTALDIARNKANVSVFAVYQLPVAAIATGPRALIGLSNGTGAALHRVGVYTHGSLPNLYPQATGRTLDADAFASAIGTAKVTDSVAGVMSALYRFSTSDLYLYNNGTEVANNTAFHTNASTSDTPSLAAAIGSKSDGSGEWFSGMIAEILIYNSPDTDGSLRAAVHSYVQNTYGISVADYAGVADEWVVSGDTTA